MLAGLFLFVGGAKLAGSEYIRRDFIRWGYPLWFVYANGVAEVAGAILLLLPRLSVLGAVILMGDMLGAVVTHVTHGEYGVVPLPLTVLVIAGAIAWARRDMFRRV